MIDNITVTPSCLSNTESKTTINLMGDTHISVLPTACPILNGQLSSLLDSCSTRIKILTGPGPACTRSPKVDWGIERSRATPKRLTLNCSESWVIVKAQKSEKAPHVLRRFVFPGRFLGQFARAFTCCPNYVDPFDRPPNQWQANHHEPENIYH